MQSVLKDWVMRLGLRHQGVLLTSVRGCDTAPKEDASKALARCFRAEILNAHCGDNKKSRSFIEYVDTEELGRRMEAFRKNCDHYPHHWVMHFFHAVQILAYKMPDDAAIVLPELPRRRSDLSSSEMVVPRWNESKNTINRWEYWLSLYNAMCRSLHVQPETEADMDIRLGADEETFAKAQEEEGTR